MVVVLTVLAIARKPLLVVTPDEGVMRRCEEDMDRYPPSTIRILPAREGEKEETKDEYAMERDADEET